MGTVTRSHGARRQRRMRRVYRVTPSSEVRVRKLE
jgi:hypothetical protein